MLFRIHKLVNESTATCINVVFKGLAAELKDRNYSAVAKFFEVYGQLIDFGQRPWRERDSYRGMWRLAISPGFQEEYQELLQELVKAADLMVK